MYDKLPQRVLIDRSLQIALLRFCAMSCCHLIVARLVRSRSRGLVLGGGARAPCCRNVGAPHRTGPATRRSIGRWSSLAATVLPVKTAFAFCSDVKMAMPASLRFFLDVLPNALAFSPKFVMGLPRNAPCMSHAPRYVLKTESFQNEVDVHD